MNLEEYRKKVTNLSVNEEKLRDLYLRDLALGKVQGPPTGYASLDKPWLKWYNEEQIKSETPNMKIYDCVYEENKDRPDDFAFEYYGKNITYREMFDNIDLLARAFKKNGVKKGDIVTVGMLTTPEAIYTMLALNKIGAISSMIDPRSSVAGLNKYLTDNGSDLVIVTDLFCGKFKKACDGTKTKKIISSSILGSIEKWPFNNQKKLDAYKNGKNINKNNNSIVCSYADFLSTGYDYDGEINEEYVEGSPSLIVHSGGTTGFPKAVVMTDHAVLSSVYQGINSGIKFSKDESWLGIMPLFIIYGASTGTLLPLIKGIKIHLVPLFNPKGLPKLLLNKKPVHMTLAPSHFENIINDKRLQKEDLSYIVAPTVGGDSMDVRLEKETNEFLQKHGCSYKVAKGYGSSETCSGVTINVSNECNELGSVGVPLPYTTISIFDSDQEEELPYNQLGEICVQGPTIMSRYLNSDAATAEVLKTHSDGKVWVHTGDLGYMTEDGMLYVTDRIKRIIINYGGFKILPSYVESVLNESPDVKKSVVVGIDDENHAQGQVPVACVVLEDVHDKNALSRIKKYCNEHIKDSYQIPEEFIVLDDIPIISTNGKVDVKTIKSMVEERKRDNKVKKLFKK